MQEGTLGTTPWRLHLYKLLCFAWSTITTKYLNRVFVGCYSESVEGARGLANQKGDFYLTPLVLMLCDCE